MRLSFDTGIILLYDVSTILLYDVGTMNTKVLTTLEYVKIREMLADKCQTPIGREEAENLLPMDVVFDVERAQEETSAALSRLFRYGSLSCSGARDIRESLLRLNVGANLGIVELLNIGALLQTASRVKTFGAKREDHEADDVLDTYFSALDPVNDLRKEIERCILSEEEIADDASPTLKSIRRKMQSAAAKIRSELNSLLVSQGSYLRDNVITQRNGRYCIPVKSEFRAQVPGMIHDESGSGSTVFIEPMSVVRLNNEIRQLEIDEEKEIEAILATLSAKAADHTGALEADLKTLSHLDFVFAKASLARDMKATRPVFNLNHALDLKQARHPLLQKDRVVPVDIRLGSDFYHLIITGPNTGGKTVSLKTAGLLQLMGQAGLHIPAAEASGLGIFTEIYADIGDEQSIEQNLSTFSSHMKNIVRILDKADGDSFVLLDELCSGTDPQEGAALAIAILNFLLRMQVRTMATTHYSELKLFALSTDGVENASCEFDLATLSPTYRLLIGIPGKSNAFAISRRLGLPGFIIDEAGGQIDESAERFEDVIRSLDASRRKLERDKSMVGQLKSEAKRMKEDLEKQESGLEEQRQKILAKARKEAADILQSAKEQVDETIRALNKSGNDVRELEQVRQKTREMLNENRGPEAPKAVRKGNTSPDALRVGDSVMVLTMNLKGTVSTLPDAKGNLYVQMGILRSLVHVSDVEKLEEETVKVNGKKVSGGYGTFSKASSISSEINLIGKTVDEALPELDKYLDDAYLAHLPSARIVHGKGSGILRNAVQNHLKKLSYVKEFHLGEFGEGDAGVTIAVFK